ncbi:MAG: intradiol ring-cleavage dioxygenase [Cyclobacteriaceae bacterium]|nr:intradiol ring-cleavage dioxygenase [Cyclobacteriaceae bacterium]
MKRNDFIKRLGMSSVIIPVLASCNIKDGPTPITEETSTDTTDSSGSATEDSCTITNTETAGPFPTKNPSSLEHVDIRSDRTGVDLDVEITILNGNDSCSPLEGAIVDIWHCDKDGYYSEYGGTGMQSINFTSVHFLRGRQVTDSNGKVGFTTIFPGWYNGRATHIHVHIYDKNGNSLLVTQIAFPEGSDSAVAVVNAATAYGYTKGMSGYTYNSKDNVFSDGVATELSTISGSLSDGFSLTHSIVVNG